MKFCGLKVIELRKAKGLTQEILSCEIGMTQGTIARIERGGLTPSVETLAKLASFFEVSPGYFFV